MASEDRDRRTDGRAEQSRPRDRSGRPLPYDTEIQPLAEDHDPETVEEALDLGVRLWNDERFFEAHECLEAVWHAAPQDDTDFWQGVIQIAVAGVHIQRGNRTGALALLERAAGHLEGYPDLHRGVDVAVGLGICRELAAGIVADGLDASPGPGRFPAGPDGPWFTADPSSLTAPDQPTPVPDEPVWLAAGRRREPRRREPRHR